MTLTVTGGVGPFLWNATGLPPGLTLNTVTGEISGTPTTCGGPYAVTVKVADMSQLPPCCCAILSRTFYLFIDCWANHICNTCASYYACNTCNTCNTCTAGCDCRVEIGSGLAYGQTNVLVNDKQWTIMAGNESKALTSKPCQGSIVTVDQIVPGPDAKTRYVVIGSNYKPCTDIDNRAYFNYAKEVYLDFASDPSGVAKPGADGWYLVGGDCSATAPSPVDSDIQNSTRYIFQEFSLPDGTTNLNKNLVSTPTKAGSVIAKYDKYFLLTLKSDYPFVNETSWKPEGTATWDLALGSVPAPTWWANLGAKLKPVNAKGNIEMNESKTVEILWKKDCTIPLIIMLVLVLVVGGLVYYFGFYRRRKIAPEPPPTQAKRKVTARKKAVRRRRSR